LEIIHYLPRRTGFLCLKFGDNKCADQNARLYPFRTQARCPKNKNTAAFAALEQRIMKKKILAIALCLVLCVSAVSLASCTAGTNGGATDATTTTTEKTTEKHTEKATEKQTNAIEGAESIVGDITDGVRDRMGDPRFFDHPHRGITPSGK
jgi:hypothetical protein